MQVVKKQFSDEQLIRSLKNGNESAFKQIYHQCFKQAEIYITQNSGTINDAKDLFQEAMFVLVKKLRDPNFVLNVKPVTYLTAIVRNKWLDRLRQRKNKPIVSIDDTNQTFELIEELEETNYEAKHILMEKVFTNIGTDCQQLLRAFYYEKRSLKEIAEIMSYTIAFVRVKKYRCMNSFKKKVMENPSFQTL